MKKILILVLSIAFYSVAATASPADEAMKDKGLLAMMKQLKEADGYTYQLSVTTFTTGKQTKTEVFRMLNYQSLTDSLIYSSSPETILFVCPQGQFRVNFKERVAYYAIYDNGNGIKAMMQTASGLALDTMFLSNAKVASRKEDSRNLSYRLTYPKGSMITGMEIVYAKNSFFNSISYTIERPMAAFAGDIDKSPLVRQQVMMNGYERKRPPEIAAILPQMNDIKAYLERTYKGFKIERI